MQYEQIETPGVPIKAWVRGVDAGGQRPRAAEQVARLPFVHAHVAVMPDVHFGIGATVGSVIPTMGAIVPGRGRRRHRLRHDGALRDDAHRAAICRTA